MTIVSPEKQDSIDLCIDFNNTIKNLQHYFTVFGYLIQYIDNDECAWKNLSSNQNFFYVFMHTRHTTHGINTVSQDTTKAAQLPFS